MSKIIIIAVIVLIVAGGLYFEAKRGGNLGRLAAQYGFTYNSGFQSAPSALVGAEFDLLMQGDHTISNKMEGLFESYSVALFDYSYSARISGEGSGAMPTEDDHMGVETRSQSVIWIKSHHKLPEFDVSPSDIHGRKVAGRFGFSSLSIESDPQFEKHYNLLVKDVAACRQLFDGAVRAQLLSSGLVIESRGDDHLIYRFGQRLKAKEIPAFLEQAKALIGKLDQNTGA